MSIVKEKNRYVPYLNGNRFIPANDYSIATYEEMQTFINNMDSPTLSIDGSNIIMNFTPFPEKYVNYISQHQEIGIRKQVFIQLVSWTARNVSINRRTNHMRVASDIADIRNNNSNPLYHWTIPATTVFNSEGYYKNNVLPEEARAGKKILTNMRWVSVLNGKRPTVLSQKNHLYDAEAHRRISFVIVLANPGMNLGYVNLKKSSNSIDPINFVILNN